MALGRGCFKLRVEIETGTSGDLVKGWDRMVAKVCFVVKVSGEFCTDGYHSVLQELAAMPEIETVEQIEGIGNLLIRVRAPADMRAVADKILAKKGIKGLRILDTDPAGH
jgi:hypothetical protein